MLCRLRRASSSRRGCVTLRDIHPVKMEHIDTAIVYAASMLADTDSTLNKLFTGMVASKSLLEKVTDRQAVPGKGYMGWIRKERVILGNRAMMMDYGIKVPSQEYEQHHTLNQRRIVYMAVAGVVRHVPHCVPERPQDRRDLELVHRTGMYLVVDCDDFNCDVRLLETAYGLPTGSVKVLSGAEHEAVAPAVAWLPESEGSMLHLGSFRSLVGGLVAAAGRPGREVRLLRADPPVLASTAVGCADDADRRHCRAAPDRHCAVSGRWLVITLFFPLMAALRQHRMMLERGSPMYRAREKQMSIYDYLPPYHGELCNANRWVRLADAIDWDGFEKPTVRCLPRRQAGVPARVALGCRIIQLHDGVRPRGRGAGAGKPLPAIFLGFESFTDAVPFRPGTVARFRARIPDKAVAPGGPLLRSFQ